MMRARTRAPGNPGLELPGCKVAMVLAAVALACCVPAHALDPNQPATSYLRTTFTVEDGLSSNVVNAIVQTRNGFLWIATDAGLKAADLLSVQPRCGGRLYEVRQTCGLEQPTHRSQLP